MCGVSAEVESFSTPPLGNQRVPLHSCGTSPWGQTEWSPSLRWNWIQHSYRDVNIKDMQSLHHLFFSSSFILKIKASSCKELKVPELLTQQQRICTFLYILSHIPPTPHFPSTFPSSLNWPYINTVRDVIKMPDKEKLDIDTDICND